MMFSKKSKQEKEQEQETDSLCGCGACDKFRGIVDDLTLEPEEEQNEESEQNK